MSVEFTPTLRGVFSNFPFFKYSKNFVSSRWSHMMKNFDEQFFLEKFWKILKILKKFWNVWIIFWNFGDFHAFFAKNKRLVLITMRSSDLELGTVGKLFLQAFQRHQARCWKFPLCRMRAGTSSLKAQFWWWIFNFFFFWRLQGCYRETNINSCCGRLWATLGDFFQILRP